MTAIANWLSRRNDEDGLAGVRLVTAKGLVASTDAHGRYHITCAVVPNESRGSNFVLKLDDRTLPSGFRPSTRPVQVQRATRGKSLRINFGASIHRVVGLDIADAVFRAEFDVDDAPAVGAAGRHAARRAAKSAPAILASLLCR